MSTATETKTKIEIKPVNMWRVIFHNDDYTPMDFVVEVLAQLYNKDYDTAIQITQNIHETGRGVAGVYTKEVALQKANDTNEIARRNGHPLKATAEES
jgi:ATP-dependent Clp protease adaptor protein ClpS